MKNSIQLSTILLVIISSFFFGIQVNAQSVQLQESNNKNKIYFSPLNLLNFNGASAQITYGRVLKNNNEIQFSYAQRLKYFDPIFIAENDEENIEIGMFYLLGKVHAQYKSGYRIGVESQVSRKSNKNLTEYIGFELFYDRAEIEFTGAHFFVWSRSTDYQLSRSRVGLNIKVGRKRKLSDRVTLEYYYGIGAHYVHFDYKNHEGDFRQYDLNDNKGLYKFNFPINFKFAYSI